MKNPNGYGSIYKLSGKRRKPFGVRKTIGWDKSKNEKEMGKQLYENIGYYKTRPEAMIALAEYNRNPYSMESTTITFAEIYEKWKKGKFNDKTSKSTINGYGAAYKLSSELYNLKFAEIKKPHMQSVIDKCKLGWGSKRKIKVLFNQLFKFCLENDIVTKDYSAFVDIGENDSESTRKPFTSDEIKKLWDNVHRMDFIDTILIMIYTGMRPGELILIETANVNIENRSMIGGIKTSSGKNRVIPINNKIIPFIKHWFNENHKFLIVNHEEQQMKYWNYYEEKWKKIMLQLEMKHLPHDCRHTFASLMDSAGANKLCIKRIMGHASKDITDKVYTHKDIEELKEAVDLL